MEVPDLNKIGEILLKKCFPVCIFDIFIASLPINLNPHQAEKGIYSMSSNVIHQSTTTNFSPQEIIAIKS